MKSGEKMKKILIVMHDMGSGGAQKSLLTWLSEMEAFQDKYEVNLLLMKREGLFLSQIPAYIKFVQLPKELICMHNSILSRAFWKAWNEKILAAKLKWIYRQSKNKKAELGRNHQLWWDTWSNVIPESDIHYDVAVSYLNGYTNYYVIDKILADKKVLWIHNDYSKLGQDADFDRDYYSQADQIVTISDACAESFIKVFPELKEKVRVIENISSSSLIWNMARINGKPDEYKKIQNNIILSIGRLAPQKSFDLALEAAKILKDSGYKFKWFIIGKGPLLKGLLRQRKKLGLVDCVEFLGERSNPYVYMNYSDVFVQTSKFEGKSIVLDEAKILCKPIVVTNYTTVTDSIKNNEQGLIVEIDSIKIADGIKKLLDNKELRLKLTENLSGERLDNTYELKKYLKVLGE